MHHFAHSASPDRLTAFLVFAPCATPSSTRRHWYACCTHTIPSSERTPSAMPGISSRSATSTSVSSLRDGKHATSWTNCCRYARWQHSTCTIATSFSCAAEYSAPNGCRLLRESRKRPWLVSSLTQATALCISA